MKTGADTLEKPNVHQGHNLKRVRESKGLSQHDLESLVHLSQQTISRYEDKKVIDDEMLQRFSKALEVPVEIIKEMEEDNLVNFYIENSTFGAGNNFVNYGTITNNNALEEILKLSNEKIDLYERMLANEKEKITLLEKLLDNKN